MTNAIVILKLTKDQKLPAEEMGATNEDYYIVLTALTGLAFLLAAVVIGYILYSLYKVSVEQKCLCLWGRPVDHHGLRIGQNLCDLVDPGFLLQHL